MSESFHYQITGQNKAVIVSLQGRINKEAKDSLNKCQSELAKLKSKNVILNFKDVPVVDHVALRDLTLLQNEARKLGVHLCIVGLNNTMKSFLMDKGVIRQQEIRASIEEALRSVA